MHKLLFLVFAALLGVAQVWAVPAKPTPLTIQQPDGTTLTVLLVGDESFHYYQTLDGIPLVRHDDGSLHYACLQDGLLRSTGVLAHEAAQRTPDEARLVLQQAAELSVLQQMGSKRTAERNARRAEARAARQLPASRGVGTPTYPVGDRKGIVILVNYQDVKMNEKHTNAVFTDMMNKEGFTDFGNACSVHDYFKAQSYGQLNLTFDVVGPVTVSGNMADYGCNDAYGSDGTTAAKMVYEACQLADKEVDFADYDWNGDGEAEQVFVIFAGYNEAQGGPSASIWPHEWCISYAGYYLTLDGVKINTYGCTSELTGSAGSSLDGIGTACHEFSHCLGLPDMYDTSRGNFGMGRWSIMDQGTYAGNGYAPVGYTSYERMFSGWLTPTELTESCFVENMKPLTDSPEAYIIYNEADRDEYYLLENRQKQGSDAELSGHGLLVLHVDYDMWDWSNNTVNNSYNAYERCTIIPADGSRSNGTSDLMGDPYPGIRKNTELTDDSSPQATLHNKNTDGLKLMHKPITAISEQNGRVSFRFMGGLPVAMPQQLPATLVSSTAFTANWTEVADAENYQLEMRRTGATDPAEMEIAAFDFTQKNVDLIEDSGTDIADDINAYMGSQGWTAAKAFRSAGKLKLGTGFVAGWLASPVYPAVETGFVTVRLTEQQFKASEPQATVLLKDANGNILQKQNVTLEDGTHFVHFEMAQPQPFSIGILGNKRLYIEAFGIYDGKFNAADFGLEPAAAATATADHPATQTVRPLSQYVSNSTSQRFDSLAKGATYEWRVKAYAPAGESEWTAWQQVQLPSDDTAILPSPMLPDTPVEVYTLAGRRIATTTLRHFDSLNLPAGTYLLRGAQGQTLKVLSLSR
ncbi:MAG: M6 family metalloprotease domain-containing protein [Alloprevotella sp.]